VVFAHKYRALVISTCVFGVFGVFAVFAAGACVDLDALQSSPATPGNTSGDSGSGAAPQDPVATTVADSGAAAVDLPTDATPNGAGPSWLLYSLAESFPNQWSAAPLAQVWTGANAPPPRGIIAVTQLTLFDRLLVWTDEGKFYVREKGAWQAPQSTATAFPSLAGRDFRGVYHQPRYPSAELEELTFVDNPTAILYSTNYFNVLTYETSVTMQNEPAPYGAPKASKKLRWVSRAWNPGAADAAASLIEFSGYENDDYVYLFDATAQTVNKWLFADAPLFKGKSNVPSQDKIRGAWRDDPQTTTYLIVAP
jgi:hypothetical protein